MIDNGRECKVLNLQGKITYSTHKKPEIHCEYWLWGQVHSLYIPWASCAHLPFANQVISMSFKLLHNTKEYKDMREWGRSHKMWFSWGCNKDFNIDLRQANIHSYHGGQDVCLQAEKSKWNEMVGLTPHLFWKTLPHLQSLGFKG